MPSLRKAINQNCADCVYDNLAAGTRLQQITLCSVYSCAFWEVRPKTTYPIPESVYSYYGVKKAESEALNAEIAGTEAVGRDDSENSTLTDQPEVIVSDQEAA